jgi:hypothetical protein
VFRWLLGHGFPIGELDVVDTTIRMFAEPKLGLDKPRARKLLAGDPRQALGAAPPGRDQGRGVQHRQVRRAARRPLRDRDGNEGRQAQADGTPRWLPALAKTDPFYEGLLEHENPDVQALAAIRLEVKSTLEETRLYRMLSMHTAGRCASI